MSDPTELDLEPALAIVGAEYGDPTRAGIRAFTAANHISPSELHNALMLSIARRFLDGAMSFDEADGIANTIYALMVEEALGHGDGYTFPEPAYAIYLAFDDGEWNRGDGIDPVERYTRVGLRRILGER